MARLREVTKDQNGINCDFCNMSRGQTAKVVHHLKFQSVDDLRNHLRDFYGEKADKERDFIGVILNWYHFVHDWYSKDAAIMNQPLWQHYLERHGVRVHCRNCRCEKCQERLRPSHMREL